jgi:hypothetical protein
MLRLQHAIDGAHLLVTHLALDTVRSVLRLSTLLAMIRSREPDQNGSLASRLPRFLKDHKNRTAVLKAISTLERPKNS